MKQRGVTLIEILVATFILSIISVPLYYVMKDASHKRAIIACKDYVKQESNKILKILENDLSQARRNSFKQPSDNVYEIKVQKDAEHDAALRYVYVAPDLMRQYDGKQWLISRNVTEFNISTTPDAPGRLVVSLKTKANFDGVKDDEAPQLSQEKMIVMREDAAFENDKHWRDVGDVNKFFATQGSLMAGVKSDAKKLVQDFTGEFADAVADINSMTIGQLQKVKDDLMGGLKDVEESISSIDKDILDLDPKALYDTDCMGNLSKSEKRRAKAVKEALAAMDTKDKMDWNKIKEIGGGSSFFSSGMKTEAIKEMYNAKMQLFESGQEIVKQIDDFKKMSSDRGFSFDTSMINRRKWGL
ncbi:MAG: hypothetical protein Kow0029_23730 [Candidatus Rifleibacteriota bacterium]